MATKFDIEKFNGRNFSLWKLKMKAIMRKDGCLAAISERPVDFTDDNKWIEMDGNAMANFHLALADEVLSSIEEKKTAKEIWHHLTKLYEATSLHNKIFLKRKLYTLSMPESTSVTEHLNTLNTLFSQLTSLSCKIGEQERVELLLQSLPDSYDQLIINLTNSNVTSLVFDDVAAAVLQEENRCNDHALEIVGLGTIKLKMYDGTIKVVQDVFRGALVVLKGEKITANLYMLKGETLLEAEASVASCSSDSAMLWHKKLGHMSEQGMKVLVEQKLLPGLTKVSLTLCEHCITSKQHLLKFNTSNSRGKSVLELVHSDVWQAPVTSLSGEKYFVSFIDDYSRRCWVHPIKKKSDVFSTFKNFKARMELDSGNKIKCFRTDNGGEYISEEFDDFCRKEGIKRQFTVANTPQQNGVAERMNRTLLEITRAMLRDAGLEKSLWAEAVNTACYLVNRAPSTIIELKTPMEMWTGKPADYSNLHVFGSIVYVMYNSQEISKLDPKSRKCKFLGYADRVKGYRLWDLTAQFEQEDSSEAELAHDEQKLESSEAPTPRQSDRVRRRPNWHSYYVIEGNIAYCLLTEDGEPSTYQEAINNSDVSLWMMAMQEEIEALHKNNTWDLVPLPQGRKPIGNKWVFKIKRNGDDQVERYRARLVVKGYAQKEGIDFNEIFSPVVRLTTVRVVLAMCATLNLHLEQLDVKTTFLHGNLEEEIYMLQPEGFEEEEKKNLVCRLNKYLYGLKQAPMCWYKRFDSFIMCLGYNRLNADPCAYLKRSSDNDFVILLLYMDDMLVAGPNKDHIEELKAQLAREFEMKDLGSVNKIIGMQIHRDKSNRKIWFSQKNYLKKILSRFNMQDCKPISTPLPINFKLSSSMSPSSEKERMEMSRVPYASAVGSLMFAMIYTRPDIAQAVGVVSRYMANPGKEHWNISVVAISTTEAEYVASTQASKEAIWLKILLEELGHNQEYVSLFCDSQSALHLARNPAFHSRTKHIRVQYHFIREKVEEGAADMQKIYTKDNIADFMTKAINADKFSWCRSSCGLSETSAIEEECYDINEPSLWYGRRIGSRKMGFEERTPLLIASLFGSKDVVNYIVECGRVDVNQTHGSDGVTALHCAVSGGSFCSTEVVRILLDAAADINSLDAYGNRPIDLIAPARNSTFNLKKKMLESLLKGNGCDDEIEGLPEEIEGCSSMVQVLKDETEKKEYTNDFTLLDIKSEIYGTDEFRMYNFKVTPCSRAYSHDWTECPFVHPGENARRRDPRKYIYSCVPCPEFRKSSCKQGDNCKYAHGSAVPSPRSYSTTGSYLDIGSMSPQDLGSPSVLLPSISTPPLTPTGTDSTSSLMTGVMWPNQSNIVPSLQLHGSRLKTARRVRNMELGMEQLGPESCRHLQTQQLIDEIPGLSSSTNQNNPLSTISTFSASSNGTDESNWFGGIPLDTSTHQLQSPTPTRVSYMTNLPSSPMRASQSFVVDPSRLTVGTILSPSPTTFGNRSSSFMEFTSVNHHSGFSSPSAVSCNFSDWGSPDGKLGWGIRREELTKLTMDSCFGFQSSINNLEIQHNQCRQLQTNQMCLGPVFGEG
ncbi:putative Double Clp-N motif-containing P-loop nucleoside triphosphate hydrolases superfamily protein [Hibiscus syriacus]|uniref:Double Clp-N motif-containing P-loop nucleoside triphosphate hydrolases superfamily protein n=1 Tax=Hibiscus syriacus TaxID=106335 RepID=A0A6A2YM65_HIBSY|nr:putative Double Clp-N motif-containing P-loop nucleoside triphosphate hydrolases superfamily protein [Hibiscus syriacus]